MNIDQIKLEVQDTYKKDEKKTTDFEAVDDKYVINKAYLDEKLKKIEEHISYIEKDYNKFILQYNKQSLEGILIQRAVKQRYKYFMIRDYLIIFKMVIRFLEDFLFATRRRGDLEEVNDNVQ